MILYRIVNKDEHNAIKNASYEELNELLSKDGIGKEEGENDKYIYFFPYYEVCSNYDGEYVIKVEIDDTLLEREKVKYLNPVKKLSKYVILDEYRIKKEKFDGKNNIVDVCKKSQAYSKWEANYDYLIRVNEAMDKITPTLNEFEYDGKKINKIDYSGLINTNYFKVNDDVKDVLEVINEKLDSKINLKDENNVFYFDDECLKNSQDSEKNGDLVYILNNLPSYRLEKIVQKYGSDNVKKLFTENMTKEQIRECMDMLENGNMIDNFGDYFFGKSKDTLLYTVDNLYKKGFNDEIRNKDFETKYEMKKYALQMFSRTSIGDKYICKETESNFENKDFIKIMNYIFDDVLKNDSITRKEIYKRLENLDELNHFYKADADSIIYLDKSDEKIKELYSLLYYNAERYNLRAQDDKKINYNDIVEIVKEMDKVENIEIDDIKFLLNKSEDMKETFENLAQNLKNDSTT